MKTLRAGMRSASQLQSLQICMSAAALAMETVRFGSPLAPDSEENLTVRSATRSIDKDNCIVR